MFDDLVSRGSELKARLSKLRNLPPGTSLEEDMASRYVLKRLHQQQGFHTKPEIEKFRIVGSKVAALISSTVYTAKAMIFPRGNMWVCKITYKPALEDASTFVGKAATLSEALFTAPGTLSEALTKRYSVYHDIGRSRPFLWEKAGVMIQAETNSLGAAKALRHQFLAKKGRSLYIWDNHESELL